MNHTKTVYTISDIKNILSPTFKNYNVIKADVFGSYAREEATPDSDIDLLIETDDSFGLSKYNDFMQVITETLKKNVDLVDYNFINKHMRDDILKEAINIYEQA